MSESLLLSEICKASAAHIGFLLLETELPSFLSVTGISLNSTGLIHKVIFEE